MSAKRALLVMLFAACLRTDNLGAGDAGADDGGTLRCAFVPGLNKTVCVTPPERVICGGQRCEPAFLPPIAEALAAARGVTREALVAQTSENARRLFRL